MEEWDGWGMPPPEYRRGRSTKGGDEMRDSTANGLLGFIMVVVALIFLLGLIAGGMYGCPQYNVWQKELAGKAELKQADWNRQIAIREAEALKESASELAEAEVIRAKGVAQANEIIGQSLKDNEAYLRYLWIQGLQDGSSEIIYVPTEANLPILEATRKAK